MDGKLSIENMEKYCLDESGAVKKGADDTPLLVQYRVVETLPDGYSNSSRNQGAVVSEKGGSRLVTYPTFDVKSAFGYGTDQKKDTEEYDYYNEVTTLVKLTQKLYDGEHSQQGGVDGNREWKLFYQVGTDELTEYEEFGNLTSDASGLLELTGLPMALKDSSGNYKQVNWFFGQAGIGPDEQLEYRKGEEYLHSVKQTIGGTDYDLIPFDFSENPIQTLSTYRLVMKAGIKVYKYDDNNNAIHGAEFKVTCGGEDIKPAIEGSSASGIVFWIPMFKAYTIEETVAPDGYMKGEPLSKDPILSEDARNLVTPATYAAYTSLARDESTVIYTDSRYPLLQVNKWNYAYDETENRSVKEEVSAGQVQFELYRMTENADGSKSFTKVDAVHNPAKSDAPDGSEIPEYTDQFNNGESIRILPGTYYLAEVFDTENSNLEGYINPDKLENIQWEIDGEPGQEVIRQDGKVYYPLGEFEKNDERRICSVTNYHNRSGSLEIAVEDMLSERGFAETEGGHVELTATAVGPDGRPVYTSTVEVSGGAARFENMPIFDEQGNYLTYQVVQTTDHPGYSHSSETVTIEKLEIGKTTQTQDSLDNLYDFHEYPRLDVTVQVNWVKDLTYDQLSDAEKPSAQEKLPGAVINVYEKKTDPDGNEYYELIQTCTANENGVVTATGLEEFPEYVFVKAGYDKELHTDALNPESTGEKDFDRHRYDPNKKVTLTKAELDEKYDYLPYQYIKTNSSITEGTVVLVDMATEVIIDHELWMQLRLSKLRYYTARLDAVRDGIYKITPKDDGTYDYEHYRSETFSYENQDGQVSETGTWSEAELEEMIQKASASKTQARVIYDNNKQPKSILFGNFSVGQNAMYNMYRVRLSELTEEEVKISADGQINISIDFQTQGKWELVDDNMVTDEFGETISKEQIADDSYIYFLVETKEPYTSLGMQESSEVMETNYVTVFHKSGAEYTYTDENGEHAVPLEEITYQCKTVNHNKKPNCKDWVNTSVSTYDINTDTDAELLNKGYIGKAGDPNHTNCYGFVQFNKWKQNKAYDENDPNGEKMLTPVSSALFQLYHSKADGTKAVKVGRDYETAKTKYSSDAYVTTDIIYPGSYYLSHLNSILAAYAKAQGTGPKNLTELNTAYDKQEGDKIGWLNDYVRSAMEACGNEYATMFYVSNVITNLAENAEDILNAPDARLDSYARWGITGAGRAGTAATLDDDHVTEVPPAYFDLFDASGENGRIAVGFAQQVAYNVCEKNASTGDAVNYVLTDGFPLDGNGVPVDGNAYGTRRGVYRFIYMHCYILETEAPAGTFLNTEPKNLLLQSGAYFYREANGESWGSWWEASTTNCINTYAGKGNLNNTNNYNRTWYYSDETYINHLGDVDKQEYIEKGEVSSVDYSRALIKLQGADSKNIGRYLNQDTTTAETIKYTKLTGGTVRDTGYYSGKRYINDTQVGYTVKVQSLGYPSLLTTYGKTDNELQLLYETNELFIRNGILAGTYRLQKWNEEENEYQDFVYPRTHEEEYGHFREEQEEQSLCEFNTYEENTDPEVEEKWKACVFTFPQGLGLGVYRLVPCAEGKSKGLISGEEYPLNDRYYDTYAENGAYRYFRVARTSADQYVDVFYPELPNILVIKQENSPNGSPYRTGKSLEFTLSGTGALTREETKKGNTADFRLLKEGIYKLGEGLTDASGSLTDIYYKKDTGIKVEVIDIGEGVSCNKKKQKIEGLPAEVDAPVFNGYRITGLEGKSVAVPDEQVTEESKDATATIRTEMATTFNVYMSNPQSQNFRVKKIDALTKKGLQNARFKVYFRPFDLNTIETDKVTSNNKVILKANPAVPKLDADGNLTEQSIWELEGDYISNSNGLLMKIDAPAPGITGAPGWYYLVETQAPQGKNYDIAEPLLFAYTGTLAVENQNEAAVRNEDGNTQIVVEDSDKICLTVDKFFSGSTLTGQHKLKNYELRLYKDAACTEKAAIYDYEDGRYKKKSDSLLLKGENAGAGPGGQDLRAGSVTVYMDYNESDAYYLKETMTAENEKEAALWLADCSQLKSNVSFIRLVPVSKAVSGNQVTVVWRLTDFASGTVNQSHKVDARVWNVYGVASVKMFKTISTNTDYALTGAKFELSSNGKVLDTAISGEEKWDGSERYNVEFEVAFGWDEIVSSSQESGKPEFTSKQFTVKEIEAPPGYQVSQKEWNESVLPGQTIYLRKEGQDFIDMDGITLRLTKYDNVASAVGKKREMDQEFRLHVKKSADAAWEEVGEVQYTDEDGLITFPAVSVGTADFRYRYALTYEGAKEGTTPATCGLDKITIHFNGVDYELHEETEGGKTYYVLNGDSDVIFAAGMTYLINAYDVPKSELLVKKEILGAQQTSKVVYGLHKIEPGEDLSSKEKVLTAITGYEENEYTVSPAPQASYRFTGLEAGSYLMWEISTEPITIDSETSQEVVIDLDHPQVVWYDIVDVNPAKYQGQKVYEAALKNRPSGVKPDLEKTVDKDEVPSLLDQEAELTYTITPALSHKETEVQRALTAVTVEDTGLSFYSDTKGKQEITENTPDYSFTVLTLTQPSYEDGSSGSFVADVTFIDKNGTESTERYQLPLTAQDISGKKAVSFRVSYTDTAYQASHPDYAAGEGLIPGTVTVQARVNKSVQSADLVETLKIKNMCSFAISYPDWKTTFEGSVEAKKHIKTDRLEKEAVTNVLGVDVPVLAIEKSVDPEGEIPVDRKLEYTITVANIGSVPMENAVLVDQVPAGLSIDTSTDGWYLLEKVSAGTAGTEDITVTLGNEKVKAEILTVDGEEILIFRLTDTLAAGSYYRLTLVKERCAVTSSALLNKDRKLTNRAYVTALEKSYQYNKNKSGNAFKDAINNTDGIYNSAMDVAPGLENALKAHFGKELCGVLEAEVENTVKPGEGFVTVKSEHGNLDSNHMWISDLNSVSQVSQSDGTIEYRLAVTNAENDAKKGVVLFDIFPYVGDFTNSQWTLKADTAYSVTAKLTDEDGRDTELVNDTDFKVTYGNLKEGAKASNSAHEDYDKIVWSDTIDADASYNAVRIEYLVEQGLGSGETLTVTVQAKLLKEADATTEEWIYREAINRFGVFHKNEKGEPDRKSSAYSNRVKAQLIPSNVGLSGKVWIDTNQNSTQDAGDLDVNSYKVVQMLFKAIRINLSGYRMSSSTVSSSAETGLTETGGIYQGTYQFTGLTSARPMDDQFNVLYTEDGTLDPYHLQGSAVSYSLELVSEGQDEELIRLADKGDYASYSYWNENALVRQGYKNIPVGDGQTLETKNSVMKTDSNFRQSTGLNGVSDRFFLFSAEINKPVNTITNDAMDAGVQIDRQITVTKKDSLGNLLPGVEFEVYAYDLGVADYNGAGTKVGETFTTDENGQFTFRGNYFKNYKVVEKAVTDPAYSGQTEFTTSYKDIQKVENENAWIIQCIGEGDDYSRLREELTIINKLAEGTIRFDKRKETGKNTFVQATEEDGFRFTLTYKDDAVNTETGKRAWKAYLEKIANAEDLLVGCSYEGQSGQSMTVKVTGGTTTIKGLPMGTYELKEETPQNYVAADPVTITLTKAKPDIQAYNKDTAESQNPLARAYRSVKRAVGSLFQAENSTTSVTDAPKDTKVLVNYQNNAELFLVKKGTDKTGEKILAGAEFTLYEDEDCKQALKTYTSTVDADGISISFENLSEGENTFYLKETKSPGELWALNENRWTIHVTVEAGKQPQITVDGTAAGSTWDNPTLTVKDTYLERSGTVSVTGSKQINGKSMAESALNNAAKRSFGFTLYKAEQVAGTMDYTVGAELKDASIQLAEDGSGSFSFENFDQYDETMHGGNFYYAIRENEISEDYKDYLAKDETWFILAVHVENNPDEIGKMKTTTTVYRSATTETVDGTTTVKNVSAAPDNRMVFDNTYTTKPENYSLKVGKKLDGREIKANEFEASLQKLYRGGSILFPEGAVEEAVYTVDGSNAHHGTAVFEQKLNAFTKQGFYYYQVTEKKPAIGSDGTYKKDGVTYDASVYYLLFYVEDNGMGVMAPVLVGTYENQIDCIAGEEDYKKALAEGSAEQTGLAAFFQNLFAGERTVSPSKDKVFDLTAGNAKVEFVNEYTVAPAKLNVTVGKKLDGRSIGGNEFRVQIEGKKQADTEALTGVDTKLYISAQENSVQGTAEFQGLTFKAAGVYSFTLSEVKGDSSHVTYDERTYTLTVTVTDSGDGQLYVTEAKVLSDSEGTVPTVVYTKPASENGMADGSLNLSEVQTDVPGSPADKSGLVVFENTYTSAVELKLMGTKVVQNRDGAVIPFENLTDKSFTIKLQQTDKNYIPVSGGTEKEVTTDENDGSFAFEVLRYDQTSLRTGTEGSYQYKTSADFYYLVTETAAGAGYDANAQKYRLHVILTKEANGDLSLQVMEAGTEAETERTLMPAEAESDGTPVYALDGQNFTNVYKAEGRLELKGRKKLTGLNLEDELFDFIIKDVNDENSEIISSGTNKNGNAGEIEFTPLTYDETAIGRTFTYTVQESWKDTLTDSGYSQVGEKLHKLDVQVEDGGSGKLKLTVTVDGDEQKKVTSTNGTASITEREWLKFENKYSIDELTAVFTAYKSINGSMNLSEYKDANPEFTFSLYEAKYEDGRWVTVGDAIDTQTVDLDTHSVTFSGEKLEEDGSGKNKLKFGADDLKDPTSDNYLDEITKYFLIQEDALKSETSGKHFDAGTQKILVKVDLYRKSGRLQLNPSYAILEGDTTTAVDESAFGTDDAHHTINNTYTGSIELGMEGSVALNSNIRDMADQSFTVQVTDVTDTEHSQKLSEYTVGAGSTPDGTMKVGYTSPDNLLHYDQTDLGKTYTYTITQTKMTKGSTGYDRDGNQFKAASGYTADTEIYKVTVTIGVNENGYLKADYTVTDQTGVEKSKGTFISTDSDKKIKELDFINQYAAKGKIVLMENTTFRAEKGTATTVSQWLDTLDANGQKGFDYRVYAAEKNEAESNSIDLAGRAVLVSHRDIKGDYVEQPADSSDAKLQALKANANLYQLDENQVSKDYTDMKSESGSYYYYVEQVIPAEASDDTLNGLTYGDDGTTNPRIHAYFVKATLTDDENSVDGTLKVSYAKKKVEQGAKTSFLASLLNSLLSDGFTETEDGNLLTFTNTYRASGTALLTGVKKLNQRNMLAGEFKFQLQQTAANIVQGGAASELGQADSTGMNPILTATNPAALAGKESGEFAWKQNDADDYTDRYTAEGIYTYSATEVNPLPSGVTVNTEAATLTVMVKDSHDGTMTANVTADNHTDGKAFFENTYGAKGSITISGKKTINGESVNGYVDNQFVFTLYSKNADGNFTETVTTVKNPDGTAVNNSTTGIFEFTLDYTEAELNTATGAYENNVIRTYRLVETGEITSDDDYHMSEKYYDIDVTLTDNGDGTIHPWISKITPGTLDKGAETPVIYENTKASQRKALDSLIFDNTYSIKTTLTLGGKKIASGFTLTSDTDSEAEQKFKYDHFAFLLYNCDENGTVQDGEKPIDMVQLTDSAEFSFEPLTFRYERTIDDTGSHYYKIVEVRAKGTYETAQDGKQHMPEDYVPETLDYVPVSDMLYAVDEYIVKVEVTYDKDHEGGALFATSSVISPDGNDKVEFTNTYPAGSFEIPVVSAYEAKPGTNTVYGDSEVTYSYTMTPVDKDGKALTENLPVGITADEKDLSGETYSESSPVNTGNINAVSCSEKFAGQTVHNIEDHYYKIEQSETGSNAGMAFDEGYYLVKVTTVKDTKDATKLTSSISEVTYYGADGTVRKQKADEPIRFTNVYQAEPAGLSVQVGKTTDKRPMKEGEFNFELSWEEDGKTQTITASNAAAKRSETGAVVFDWIEYTKTGEHVYTLKEKNGKPVGGITDDKTVYTITVEVTDDHKGNLEGHVKSILKDEQELLTSPVVIAGKGTVTNLTEYITFANEYGTEKASVTLSGTKTINGKEAGTFFDNQFTFELFRAEYEDGVYTASSEEAVSSATSDKSDGSFELTAEFTQNDLFTSDGTGASVWNKTLEYYFIIQEQPAQEQSGYESNTASIGVTVTLTDNMDGTLKAEITDMKVQPNDGKASVKEYSGSEGSFSFDNTYGTETALTLGGKKIASGFTLTPDTDSEAEQKFKYDHFAFLLYNCDENGTVQDGEKPIDMVQLTDSAEFSFEPLTFRYDRTVDDTGSHYYKIVEVRAKGTYETAQDGKQHMPEGYASETLDYVPVSDMLYEETEYVVKVEVAYDKDHEGGALFATSSVISPDGKDKVEFTNTYPAGSFEIPVVSAYEAKPGTDTVYEDSQVTYSYTMTPVDKDGKALTENLPVGITADEKDLSGKTYSEASPVGTGNINAVSCSTKFAGQTVHNTEDHYYKIEQSETGSNAGMAFDEGYYLVKVTTVKDTKDATKLTSSISEVTYYGADGTVRKQKADEPIRFTNVYQAEPAGLSVQVGKTTDKRPMKEGEFNFELSWEEDGKTKTITASNAAAKRNETGAVVFDWIEYTKTGEHVYTLKEKNGKPVGGITDDKTVYTITVEVTDDHKGNLEGRIKSILKDEQELLTSPVVISGKDEEGKGTVTNLTEYIIFANEYDTEKASVTLLGTKTINGKETGIFFDNQFTFELFPAEYEDGVYTASSEEAVSRATSDGSDGSFELTVEFTQDDLFTSDGTGVSVWNKTLEYYFIIQEQAAQEQSGYESNTASIGVTVTLTDNMDGTLKAEITDMKVQPEDGKASVKEYSGSEGSFSFDNIYHAKGELMIPGLKTMKGATLSTMTDGIFTFEIVDAAGKVVSTAKNDKDGKITFILACDESMIDAETIFKIREVNDQKSRITYDETVYRLVVTAEDKGNGNMEATGTILKDGTVVDTAEFVNVRRPSGKKNDSDEKKPAVPEESISNGVSSTKTGDTSIIFEYTLMMFLSSCGILSTAKKKKRYGKKEENQKK